MPLKYVIYTDRQSAEAKDGWATWAAISISEPDYYPANLKEGWFDVLRLEFHDVNSAVGEYTVFSEEDALRIIEFVRKAQENLCEGILVHCHAGISRSAAVAKWIAEQYNLPFNHNYELYNKMIYRTLQERQLIELF
jgi:predicted protein tyrosine phosphatase